uniref:Mucin 1, cell surface associated n=1 Tax=Oryctolagus cuniculus TaxID=9986 RepID=A0A5F9DP70_RABIT
MPPGMDIRSPFFLLLLLPGITGEGCEVGRGSTLALQSRPGPGSAERRIASMTGGSLPTLSPGSGSAAIPGQIVITSAPATSPTSVSATSPVHEVTSAPATSPASDLATSPSGVPGWGIALLVLVCVLLALAIIYFIALAVCQCRRKNCGQLDLFPTRDTYHPMSEYPTYHTHGRYVPPGSTRRSPYEEESAGNGGSGLSYTSPPVAATSAHLAGTCTFTKGQPGAGSLS